MSVRPTERCFAALAINALICSIVRTSKRVAFSTTVPHAASCLIAYDGTGCPLSKDACDHTREGTSREERRGEEACASNTQPTPHAPAAADLQRPFPAALVHRGRDCEDLAQRARDEAPLLVGALHRERLAGASLAVREDAHVVTVERRLHEAVHLPMKERAHAHAR
eukprot:2665240-Prymnesium_polylepis.2